MVSGMKSLTDEELIDQLTAKAGAAGALAVAEGVLSGEKMRAASVEEIERVLPGTLSKLDEVTLLKIEVLRRVRRRPTPGKAL